MEGQSVAAESCNVVPVHGVLAGVHAGNPQPDGVNGPKGWRPSWETRCPAAGRSRRAVPAHLDQGARVPRLAVRGAGLADL